MADHSEGWDRKHSFTMDDVAYLHVLLLHMYWKHGQLWSFEDVLSHNAKYPSLALLEKHAQETDEYERIALLPEAWKVCDDTADAIRMELKQHYYLYHYGESGRTVGEHLELFNMWLERGEGHKAEAWREAHERDHQMCKRKE